MATWAQFWAAHDAEGARRIRGSLGLPYVVAPWLWLRALTPRDVMELALLRSPYVLGGEVSAEDTALFLWHMRAPRPPRNVRSRLAQRLLAWRQYRFAVRVGRMSASVLDERLREYLAMQLVDMGASRKADGIGGADTHGRQIEHSVGMLKLLVRVCGCAPHLVAQCMDLPLVLIWQCMRAHDDNEKVPLINESDALKLKIMLEGETNE
jgi:hypothetical protein